MRIINLTKNTTLAEEVEIAKTIWQRGKGLLGRKTLGQGKALVLWPCDSIHTFFMQFAIDVIFVDKENRIISVYENLKPFRVTRIYFKAKFAIELPIGTIATSSTKIGDTLQIQE
ncbi:MAG: DUF192 domain-containing protein [Candidatus Omnitrophota bacterium]